MIITKLVATNSTYVLSYLQLILHFPPVALCQVSPTTNIYCQCQRFYTQDKCKAKPTCALVFHKEAAFMMTGRSHILHCSLVETPFFFLHENLFICTWTNSFLFYLILLGVMWAKLFHTQINHRPNKRLKINRLFLKIY